MAAMDGVVKTVRRSEATKWRDYAVVADERGPWLFNGKRVFFYSANVTNDFWEPRWDVDPSRMDATDAQAAVGAGLTKYEKEKMVDCPRCGGRWYEDLDEDGKPYTCFFCCNEGRVTEAEAASDNEPSAT